MIKRAVGVALLLSCLMAWSGPDKTKTYHLTDSSLTSPFFSYYLSQNVQQMSDVKAFTIHNKKAQLMLVVHPEFNVAQFKETLHSLSINSDKLKVDDHQQKQNKGQSQPQKTNQDDKA